MSRLKMARNDSFSNIHFKKFCDSAVAIMSSMIPVVSAAADANIDVIEPTSRMIKPSDLPIYEEPKDIFDYTYFGRERSALEKGIGSVRTQVEDFIDGIRPYKSQIIDTYDAKITAYQGYADKLKDDEVLLIKRATIATGAIIGFIIGGRKKGGFLKKSAYGTAGLIATSGVLYPAGAKEAAYVGLDQATYYGNIGYKFIAGAKPQSKDTAKTSGVLIDPSATIATENKTILDAPAESKSEGEKDIVIMVKEEKPRIEADYGQSNPADNDMYTTRS